MAQDSGLAVLLFIDECITCIITLPDIKLRSKYCSLASHLLEAKGR